MLFQFFVLASGLHYAAAASRQSICSSENTGSDYTAVTNIYQSINSCTATCGTEYTFAVLQDANCWCTNTAPSSKVDTSECSTPCPGYPTDLCGNSDDKLFSYISSGNTASSSSAATNATVASTTSAVSSTTETAQTSVSNWNGTTNGNSTSTTGSGSGSGSSSGNGTISNSSKPSGSADDSSAAPKSVSINMALAALTLGAFAAFTL